MCPECNGDGIVITEIDEVSGDVIATEECPVCHGAGQVASH